MEDANLDYDRNDNFDEEDYEAGERLPLMPPVSKPSKAPGRISAWTRGEEASANRNLEQKGWPDLDTLSLEHDMSKDMSRDISEFLKRRRSERNKS